MAFSPATGWTDLSEAVFFHAAARPQAVALIEGAERVTYGLLAPLVAAASTYVGELGIKPREVVAIALPGTIDHVILSLALIRAGAVPLDLPPPQPGERPMQGMQHFGVRRAFVASGMAAPEVPLVHAIDPAWRGSLLLRTGDRHIEGNPDEDFYLSFTSGSTGAPKGIVTTRRQWQARYRTARKLFPFLLAAERPPHLLVIGGMAFSAFFFFLANHLFVGGPVVLMGGAHRPDRLAAAIAGWGDAALLITPPLVREFLARAPQGRVMFPDARALFFGAAPVFAEEKRLVRDRLCGNAYEVYGSAATGFLSVLTPGEFDARGRSVGRPVDDLEIEIVDSHGERVGRAQTGHLRCRGAGVSQGFYGEPANHGAGEGFHGGWYYPGDLAAIDGDGYLTLTGRLADIIRRRGVEIFPTDLEEAFLAYPAIAEAAAVDALPPGGNEPRVVVFAAPRGEVRHQELEAHCRRLIPGARFPDRLFLLRQLPKTANGKIDRPRLRQMAAQILVDDVAPRTPNPADVVVA